MSTVGRSSTSSTALADTDTHASRHLRTEPSGALRAGLAPPAGRPGLGFRSQRRGVSGPDPAGAEGRRLHVVAPALRTRGRMAQRHGGLPCARWRRNGCRPPDAGFPVALPRTERPLGLCGRGRARCFRRAASARSRAPATPGGGGKQSGFSAHGPGARPQPSAAQVPPAHAHIDHRTGPAGRAAFRGRAMGRHDRTGRHHRPRWAGDSASNGPRAHRRLHGDQRRPGQPLRPALG